MNRLEEGKVSRRERQILDIVYRLGRATAKQVHENLPDPPSYSAVRALLSTLEKKNLLKHEKESRRYIYLPVIKEETARNSALKNLLTTFFDGKPQNLIASLLDEKEQNLSTEEIEEIRGMVNNTEEQ